MKFFLISAIMLMLPLSEWKVETSTISFTIKHAMGATAKGTFGGLKAAINFDETHPELAKISASIATSTFNTNNGLRDKAVKGKDYFDVVTHPSIKMDLLNCRKLSTNTFLGSFKLTIKGKEKNLSFPFTFSRNNNKGLFSAQFTINRLAFGVGTSSWLLGDSAKVAISIQTTT